jgi:hypothetical protein
LIKPNSFESSPDRILVISHEAWKEWRKNRSDLSAVIGLVETVTLPSIISIVKCQRTRLFSRHTHLGVPISWLNLRDDRFFELIIRCNHLFYKILSLVRIESSNLFARAKKFKRASDDSGAFCFLANVPRSEIALQQFKLN